MGHDHPSGRAALDRLGFETVAEEADATAKVNRAEIEVENSEILAGAAGTQEKLVVERDGVRAEFSRDARGALKLCLEGAHLSKAQLHALGEELMGRVTQQYAYHRIMTELKERQHDGGRRRAVGRSIGEDSSPEFLS